MPIIKVWDEASQSYKSIPALKGEKGDFASLFAMEVDEDGNLYCIYEDEGATPTFELDEDCNLYYVIEE